MRENRWGHSGAFRFDENHGWLWEMESGANIGSQDDACGIGTNQVYYLILAGGAVPEPPIHPRIVGLPILQGQCSGIQPSGVKDQWLMVVENIPDVGDGGGQEQQEVAQQYQESKRRGKSKQRKSKNAKK